MFEQGSNQFGVMRMRDRQPRIMRMRRAAERRGRVGMTGGERV